MAPYRREGEKVAEVVAPRRDAVASSAARTPPRLRRRQEPRVAPQGAGSIPGPLRSGSIPARNGPEWPVFIPNWV